MKQSHFIQIGLVLLLLLVGCATSNRVAEIDSTFLEDVDVKKKLKRLPFDHSWVWQKFKESDYESVYFKPVRIDYLSEKEWQASESAWVDSFEDYQVYADEIASYFYQEMQEQIQKRLGKKYKLATEPGERVIVFEIVLTELVLSRPILRAGAILAPVPGFGAGVSIVSDPHVAFALRMTDGKSGKLLATIADRKYPPLRLIDFNKVTVTSSAREVCSNWAEIIAELFEKGRFAEIEDSASFSLLPW